MSTNNVHKRMTILAMWLILSTHLVWSASPQIAVPAMSGPTTSAGLLPGQSFTQLPDGRWLLLGGMDKHGPTASATVQDPRSGSVAVLSVHLSIARAWHSATLLPDGQVLVLGGNGLDGDIVRDAELFDWQNQKTQTIHLAVLPRAHHTATVLTDGHILIIGGVGLDRTLLTTAELLDSRSFQVSVIAAGLSTGRQDHRAIILPDGNVLVWGGIEEDGQFVTYGEVFDVDLQRFSTTSVDPHPPADLNIPVMADSVPSNGATDVLANTIISVRFSKPLQATTVTSRTVVLEGPSSTIRAKVIPTEGGMLAFVNPETPLQAGTRYTLRIQAGQDSHGLEIVPKEITFTTSENRDNEGNGNDSIGTSVGGSDHADALPPLVAAPGVTAISGQVLQLNRRPLSHVTLQIGNLKATTDETGRFLLQHIPIGHQVMVIDGRTANRNNATYGLYEDGVDVKGQQTNILSYKIWMTALDVTHAVQIPSPTISETVVTTPLLPGLELHIPAKTVIFDHDGKIATKISITPIPVDRPPFPLPRGVQVPIYFTIQPGGAYLQVEATGPKGARLFYPNQGNMVSGTRFSFWNYDADQKGWYVYGQGTVTANRKQVMPDPGVVIYEFTGAMVGGPGGPGNGPPVGGGPGGGDPVDTATGLFVYKHVDASLPDIIPISLTRTYRQGDTTSHDFGMGTSHNYQSYLIGDSFPYTYIELVLADGGRVHYDRISPGTGYADAVYQHTGSPSAFYGSTITWNPNILPAPGGWNLKLKDGTIWGFPDSYQATVTNKAALIFIQDRFGNILNINRDPSTGNILQLTSPNGRWLQFTYDGSNRISHIMDNIGRSTSYVYDASGHLQTVTDANQNTTTYTYDAVNLDQMTSITDPRQIVYLQNHYDASDRVDAQTLANAGTYSFSYTTDSNNNIIQTDVTDPNGVIKRFTFSAPDTFADGFLTGGYASSELLALGKPEQETFTYNLGTPTSNPGRFVQSVTDPLGRTTAYTYDVLGNRTSVTQLSGTSTPATTTYTYEPKFSRVSSVTDPMNNTTTLSYDDSTNQIVVADPLGNHFTASLNSLGQVVSLTDAAGDMRQFYYSGADQTSVEDPMGNRTTYVYDGAGRKLSTTDSLGEQTGYTYDGLNNLLTVTDPLNGVTQYGYDQNSNLTSVTDPRNTTNPTRFFYDSMDRIYQRTDALGNVDSYQYDQNGNVTCHTDRKGQITVFGYDAINRRTSVGYGAATCTAATFQNSTIYSYDEANRLKVITDSLSGTINRDYDGLDDLNYESTPQGTITYNFDSAQRRTSMTVSGQTQVTYGYDIASHLKNITQGSNVITVAYDSVGRRSSLVLPNGVNITYSYDVDSHITDITYQNGSTTLGNLGYKYDALGRRSQVAGSYARMDLPSSVSSATYNIANQIATWGGTTVTYDLNGNLQNDGTNTYTWDLRNQLSTISGGSTASFQYDGIHRRVEKSINGTSTSLLFDVKNVVQEESGSTPTANLLPGLETDEILARTDSAGTSYFLDDALGSTLALTNPAGAVQTSYTYEPFGNTSVAGTASTNPFQYTGRENDGTGLYFYRARYYQPTFERFVSEDPIDYRGGVNLYQFTRDNPVNLKDPCGLKPPPPPPCSVTCIRFTTLMPIFFCWDNGFGQVNSCSCPAGRGAFILPGCVGTVICDVPCSYFYCAGPGGCA